MSAALSQQDARGDNGAGQDVVGDLDALDARLSQVAGVDRPLPGSDEDFQHVFEKLLSRQDGGQSRARHDRVGGAEVAHAASA